jgi:hypothetical protein
MGNRIQESGFRNQDSGLPRRSSPEASEGGDSGNGKTQIETTSVRVFGSSEPWHPMLTAFVANHLNPES